MVRGRRLQYLVACAVSLATATLGLSSVWTTPVMSKLRNNETDIEINDHQISWMLSLSPIGFIFGSVATRFLCDQFGRRTTLLLTALPIFMGTIIAATAYKAWMLFVTKFLWGFGTGMISTVVTIYIAEIADKEIRGRLAVSTRVMFNFGGLLMMCVGPFVTYKAINYALLVMPVLFFTACLGITESPYYLLKEGKRDEARGELLRLRGKEDGLEMELDRISAHVEKDMQNSTSIVELLRGRQYRKAIIILVGLKLAKIMTGTITVQQYLSVIMEESHTKMDMPTMMIIFGAVKFVTGITSMFLIDRMGRRPLLICSYLGSSIFLALVGTYFFLLNVVAIDRESLRPYGIIVFIFILASNATSVFGFNAIGVIQGEVFPLNVKAVAITALNIYGGVLGFLVTKLFQKVKDLAGLCGVFWMYATIALIGSLFSYFVMPETKGKSLREIQVMLQGDVYDASEEELKTINGKVVEQDENTAVIGDGDDSVKVECNRTVQGNGVL